MMFTLFPLAILYAFSTSVLLVAASPWGGPVTITPTLSGSSPWVDPTTLLPSSTSVVVGAPTLPATSFTTVSFGLPSTVTETVITGHPVTITVTAVPSVASTATVTAVGNPVTITVTANPSVTATATVTVSGTGGPVINTSTALGEPRTSDPGVTLSLPTIGVPPVTVTATATATVTTVIGGNPLTITTTVPHTGPSGTVTATATVTVTGANGGDHSSVGQGGGSTVTVTTTGAGSSSTGTVTQCNVGKLQCCNSVQSASAITGPVLTLLGLLGVIVGDITALVGVTCSPITGIGASGTSCTAQPVCCTNNSFNGVVALGCTPININI